MATTNEIRAKLLDTLRQNFQSRPLSPVPNFQAPKQPNFFQRTFQPFAKSYAEPATTFGGSFGQSISNVFSANRIQKQAEEMKRINDENISRARQLEKQGKLNQAKQLLKSNARLISGEAKNIGYKQQDIQRTSEGQTGKMLTSGARLALTGLGAGYNPVGTMAFGGALNAGMAAIQGQDPLTAFSSGAGGALKYAGLNKLTSPFIDPLVQVSGTLAPTGAKLVARAFAHGTLNTIEDQLYARLAEGRVPGVDENIQSFILGSLTSPLVKYDPDKSFLKIVDNKITFDGKNFRNQLGQFAKKQGISLDNANKQVQKAVNWYNDRIKVRDMDGNVTYIPRWKQMDFSIKAPKEFNQQKGIVAQEPETTFAKLSEPSRLSQPAAKSEGVKVSQRTIQKGSSVGIISQKGKLNLSRLKTDGPAKQALKDIEDNIQPTVIGNKEVIKQAEMATGARTALTDEQQKKIIANQLKNRQKVVDLTQKYNQAYKEGKSEAELAKIMVEMADQSKVARQTGTFAGRLLQAQNIVADQSASPMQKVLALLDNAGVESDKYLKDAVKVNWENPVEVVDFYRKYVPPKFGEILTEVRYSNMLSSPLTHIVNIFSNAVQSAFVTPIEKTITGIADFGKTKLTGKEREYLATSGIDYMKGYAKALPEAWTKAKNIITGKEINVKPDLENIPTGTKSAYNIPLRALEAMDQFFSTLIKGGVTEELGKGPKKLSNMDIVGQAQKEADYRLFRQSFDPKGELGQGYVLQLFDKWNSGIAQLRRLPGGKWVLPFLQTPTNILKQGVEYSPLGLSTIPGAKKPLEQLSKTIIGTTVFAGAYQLAKNGLMSWEAPSSEAERTLYYEAGLQPYSVKIGDKWVSFSKLGPLAYPLAMAAALGDAERKNPDQSNLENISQSVGGMLQFFGDQSYVRSIGDLVEAIQGGVNIGKTAFQAQMANFAGQLIPYRSFLTWLGRITDPTYRKANTFKERLIKDLPIAGSSLEPYTNTAGQPSMRDFPLLNAISPLRVSKEKAPIALYNEYSQAKIQKGIEKRAGAKLKEGEASKTGNIYQYVKDGSLKTVDIGKISSMPEKTGYERALKQKEQFKLVDDILENLPQEQQSQALSDLGVSGEDAIYYNVARQDDDIKTQYALDEITNIAKTSADRKDMLNFLVENRREINGKTIISNGVIDNLYDINLISADEKKQLKNLTFDGVSKMPKLKTTGRGTGAKIKSVKNVLAKSYNLKKPSLKVISLEEPARLSIPKLKSPMLKQASINPALISNIGSQATKSSLRGVL